MFKAPRSQPELKAHIATFTGSDRTVDVTQLDSGAFVHDVNMVLDRDGTPEKRPGYVALFESLAPSPVRGLWKYDDDLILVVGGKVYKDDGTELYSGLTDTDCEGFQFAGKLYIINGHEFVVYDGTAVATVDPYIPTVYIDTLPAGGGDEYEQRNLLTGEFTQTFIPDGTASTFQLGFTDLDATAVTGTHLTTPLVEGEHFTVNRTTGVINTNDGTDPLGIPASGGGLATLSFTASKTETGWSDLVTGNTRVNAYGANNSIFHLYGHPDYPNKTIWSQAADPTYWPVNNYTEFGASHSAIMGKVNQYGVSIIIKEDEMYQEQYALGSDGSHTFSYSTLNPTTGCSSPRSVAVAGDNAMFLSKRGVHRIISTQVENERNAPVISEKVNRDLLDRNLTTAIAVVFGDYYLLHFPEDRFTWVHNYITGSWFAWDSFKANCFLVDDYLYFGDNNGIVHRFMKDTEASPYNDNGAAISAEFTTKMFTFGQDSAYKMIRSICIGLRPSPSVACSVEYRTERDAAWKPLLTASQTASGATIFSLLVFSTMTFGSSPLPVPVSKKVNKKKVVGVQFRFKNSSVNQSMGLLFLDIFYSEQRKVK